MNRGLPRWLNTTTPGATLFATATVLGYTPIWADPCRADLITAGIMKCHRHYRASLIGFVVMPEHIHLLTILPQNLTASQFMARLKSATANWIMDSLTADLREALAHSVGGDHRAVWMHGFRGLKVRTESAYSQKLSYIHENPVRRGLCSQQAEYLWSSAWIYEASLVKDLVSIADLPCVADTWPESLLPDLKARPR